MRGIYGQRAETELELVARRCLVGRRRVVNRLVLRDLVAACFHLLRRQPLYDAVSIIDVGGWRSIVGFVRDVFLTVLLKMRLIISEIVKLLKCNFPMNPHVRHLVGLSVSWVVRCRVVGRSVIIS